jgi:hypothetical protein
MSVRVIPGSMKFSIKICIEARWSFHRIFFDGLEVVLHDELILHRFKLIDFHALCKGDIPPSSFLCIFSAELQSWHF